MKSRCGISVKSLHASLALTLAIAGCREAKPDPLSELVVAPSATRLPVGTTQFMTATIVGPDGRRDGNLRVHWTTTNASIVTVDTNGVVQAVGVGGPASVVAEISGRRDSASFTVFPAAITSPLRLSATNPRYFTDASGRAIYLTGGHTWEDFQDVTLSDPLRRFDWTGYLDFLRKHNHNFTELWRWEQAKWIAGFDSAFEYSPLPYIRSGPGVALDAKPKFDLTRFDEMYFRRMRGRVLEAQRRGIYVSVMLFDGWSIEKKGFKQGDPWRGHPMNRANNINGIDGDPNGDGDGLETHTLEIPAIVRLQDAYVRRVVDAVGDLDNVLYEVSNETTGGAPYVAWQKHIIAVVKAYEGQKGKRHPVGMTALYPNGNDADLFASDADFVSPATKAGIAETAPATGAKVLLWDTDHLCGNCGDGPWAWRSFASGVNPVFMDVFDGKYPVTQLPKPSDPRWEDARRNMGFTLAYATRMNLGAMIPMPALCSSHYCLASPRLPDAEYLVYLDGLTSIDVDLSGTPGRLTVEWFNPKDARAYGGGQVSGGTAHRFNAPEGAAVLYLRRTR